MVQFPGDLQSYNRYSYVRNNPLTATDPSGFAETEQEKQERERRRRIETSSQGESARDRILGYGSSRKASAAAEQAQSSTGGTPAGAELNNAKPKPKTPDGKIAETTKPAAPDKSTSIDPFKTYPGKTLGVDNPEEGSALVVDGIGEIKIDQYKHSYNRDLVTDDAPNGIVETQMKMSFTPLNGRSPTEFAWINWITVDPWTSRKHPDRVFPRQDFGGKAFNDLIFDSKAPDLYRDRVPKFSNGAINFYDRPGNPIGYRLDFSTYLYDKVNKTILYRVDWELRPSGK